MHFLLEILAAGFSLERALLFQMVDQLLKGHATRLAMHLLLNTQELLFNEGIHALNICRCDSATFQFLEVRLIELSPADGLLGRRSLILLHSIHTLPALLGL